VKARRAYVQVVFIRQDVIYERAFFEQSYLSFFDFAVQFNLRVGRKSSYVYAANLAHAEWLKGHAPALGVQNHACPEHQEDGY
jgi:hypothetical protein